MFEGAAAEVVVGAGVLGWSDPTEIGGGVVIAVVVDVVDLIVEEVSPGDIEDGDEAVEVHADFPQQQISIPLISF